MECCGRRRIPLVLDELPYLQHSVPGIDSLLQHAWDGHEGAVKLFLTGSSFSVMDAAVADPRAPLYGRRTAQLEVQPMSFDEVADCRPDWSFERRAVAYGLLCGVPAYAEQVARQESPVEAAHALALSPDGPLYAEPEFCPGGRPEPAGARVDRAPRPGHVHGSSGATWPAAGTVRGRTRS